MPGMNWRELLQDYWAGLLKLPQIFKRIGFRKRNLEDELNEALLQGNLRKVFSGYDLLMLGIGITIGGGVWRLTGAAAAGIAGPAIILAYMVAGLACTFAAAAYGELVVEYPVAGGAFTYIMVVFGEFPAWMTVANQFTEYLFGMAVVARSFSSYLGDLCGKGPNYFRIGGSGSSSDWSLDLMAMAIVVVVSVVFAASGRQGHLVTSTLSTIKLAIIVFILIVGWTKGDPSNLHPFFLEGANGVFSAASIFMYAMTGFDSVTNAAEEARNVTSLPWAMLGTTTLSMTIYMLLALMLCLMVPTSEISTQDGITRAFDYVGLHYMPYVVATAAVVGCLTALLVGLYAVSRIIMVVARDWLLPPVFAHVSARTQTPLLAQLTIGAIIALIAMLVQGEFLDELVSFGQLFSMWAVVNAQMFRRYYPGIKLRFTRFGAVETMHAKATSDFVPGARLQIGVAARRKLAILHMVLLSVWAFALAVWFVVTERHATRTVEVAGCVVFGCLLFLTALSMNLLCPIQYEPTQFRIPGILMPWVPTVAIGLIFFGMASINPTGYYKIGVYNLAILAIYFLFSLPMSYIKHYKLDFVQTEQLNVVEMVCVDGQWRPLDVTTRISGLTTLGTDDWTHSRVMTWTPQTSILTRSYNPSAHGGQLFAGTLTTPTKSTSSPLSVQHVHFDLGDKTNSGLPSDNDTNKLEDDQAEKNGSSSH